MYNQLKLYYYRYIHKYTFIPLKLIGFSDSYFTEQIGSYRSIMSYSCQYSNYARSFEDGLIAIPVRPSRLYEKGAGFNQTG